MYCICDHNKRTPRGIDFADFADFNPFVVQSSDSCVASSDLPDFADFFSVWSSDLPDFADFFTVWLSDFDDFFLFDRLIYMMLMF